MRLIDIARHFGVSTSMLRSYEERGLVPPVPRSKAGYRLFGPAHIAFFACARAMQPGFTQPQIGRIFALLRKGQGDEALWLAAQAESELYRELGIVRKIERALGRRNPPEKKADRPLLQVSQLSRETGIPASTLRFWDSTGLLPARRDPRNRYRLYTPAQVSLALYLYGLKLSQRASGGKMEAGQVQGRAAAFDPANRAALRENLGDIRSYLSSLHRARIGGLSALLSLVRQVESGRYEPVVPSKKPDA